MLSNVKSRYILAKIFGVLPGKLQLLLIKNNKSIQKKLNITLETYMVSCGKRVEINGDYGKEYLIKEEILIFEGQYHLMRRHGQGKELYSNGKIQFEGEYINGRRWNGQTYTFNGIKEFDLINGEGYIREYNIHGIKTYEGDIVNGVKDGFGKEFSQGKIEYEGIFKNGKRENKEYEGGFLSGERNGMGKEYDFDGNLKYDGKYSANFWNGQGKEYLSGKLVFSGHYKWGNRWNGIGYDNYGTKIYELKNGCGFVHEYNDEGILLYEGEYKNGVKYGIGKEYNIEKQLIYDGSYINGKRSKGKGKEFNFSGMLKYEGEYLNGEWHGNGTEYESNGEISFKGVFKNGKRWKGEGTEYYSLNKIQFKGEYENGEKNGKGVEFAPDGSIIFEGEYFQNKRWNGKLNEITQLGNKKFEGNLKNGMKNGQGKEYINGELTFEGEYLDDKKWNGKGREMKKEGDIKKILLITYEKGEKKLMKDN